VIGEDNDGTDATDSDNHTVTAVDVAPLITIVKTVDANKDGTFADSEDSTSGVKNVNYRFAITNNSVVTDPLTLVSLTDDKLGVLTAALTGPRIANVNDDGDAQFESGETWIFDVNANVTLSGGTTHTNTATITAEDDDGTSVSDSDTANIVVAPDNPGTAQTPGFWKNHLSIFDQELAPLGYNRNTTWETVFNVDLRYEGGTTIGDGPTLSSALGAKGGGESGAFLRATSAALANAGSDDLNYTYADTLLFTGAIRTTLSKIDSGADDQIITVAELKAAVLDIYTAGGVFNFSDINAVASALDAMNNLPHLGANDFVV
jgi:hypothetical protein